MEARYRSPSMNFSQAKQNILILKKAESQIYQTVIKTFSRGRKCNFNRVQ